MKGAVAADETHLLFVVSGGEFAVPVRAVLAVCGRGPVAAAPKNPPYLSGLMGIAGRLLPLIDLRPCLGLEEPPEGATPGYALVVGTGRQLAAVEADGVTGLRPLPRDGFPAMPSLVPAEARRLFAGVFYRGRSIIPVVDVEALLAGLASPGWEGWDDERL